MAIMSKASRVSVESVETPAVGTHPQHSVAILIERGDTVVAEAGRIIRIVNVMNK